MKNRLIWSIALSVILVIAAQAQAPRQAAPAASQEVPSGSVMAAPAQPNPAKQASWEYVFGDKARLDPAKVAEVKAAKPGKRFWYDANNDGKVDEVWFIDIDPRHTDKAKPVLVKAVDEDGDLKVGDEPDKDSDLYIADWKADGTVDSIVDYEDEDGDQDLDSMGIYSASANGVRCWWSHDDGDDNLLWTDTNYTYDQNLNQVSCHFNGDECFYAIRIAPGEKQWTAYYENPFVFLDRDKDGVTEEVIRVTGENGMIQTLRWSFDADNDATLKSPRDYDVSISAHGPGWIGPGQNSGYTLRFGEDMSWHPKIRGFETGLMLAPQKASDFLRPIVWGGELMTWDENDVNVDVRWPSQAGERWEGILNNAYTKDGKVIFPAVGGPSCGPFNKRNEYVEKPKGANEFYFSPADQRMHIKNATRTWIDVDYNEDKKTDMFYEFLDTNGNGIVDQIKLDVNGDGQVEDTWKLGEDGIKPVQWTFESINKATGHVEKKEPVRLYNLNMALAAALESGKAGAGADDVWNMIENKFKTPTIDEYVMNELIKSDESMLYYLRLAADRRICALKAQAGKDFADKLDEARAQGDTDAMTKLVRKQFKVGEPKVEYAEFVAQLRKEPERKRVAWDDTWLPPNVGWEAEPETAYRMYFGHFDCFGKSRDVLCYPILTSPNRGGGGSYHKQQAWGMDMLHIGNTCGIGGLMLWINGKPYPVFKAETQTTGPLFAWHKGPIKEDNNGLTMECVVTNVGPEKNPYTVTFRPQAIAGRPDSPIDVTITGGKKGDKVEVGIGLIGFTGGKAMSNQTLLLDKKAGVMGLRGWQDPEIGYVGLGIVFPAKRFIRQEDAGLGPQHYAVLKYKVGETFTYSIRADWVRGHRFPVFPSAENWMDMLRETAKITKY